jgi:hypothetical protein
MTPQHIVRQLLRAFLCPTASYRRVRQEPRLTAARAARPAYRLV